MAKKKGSGELPVSNTPLFAAKEKIDPINVADEIKNSFLDYSMSVIISRALPDARDGLAGHRVPRDDGLVVRTAYDVVASQKAGVPTQ